MNPSQTLPRVFLALGLMLGPLATAGEPPVTQLTFQGGTGPTWSPNGTQIAFTSLRTGLRQIWIMPAAGEPAAQLTNNPEGAWDSDWSPDGTKIAFVSDPGAFGGNDIWAVPPTGGAPLQLSHHDDDDYFPAWSADGTQIFFTSGRGAPGYPDIWVMPAAGEPPATQLTTEGEHNSSPACSPDGTQIAFTSNRSGSYQVWVMPTSGEPATQLTFGYAVTPSWSPDGTQIAFTGIGGIWIVPSAGGQAIQLTSDTSDSNPEWSPDGTQIAFMSNRSGSFQVWVMTLNTAAVGPATATAAGPIRLAVSPNPFFETTHIGLPAMAGTASLRVIDIAGRLVRELMPPAMGSASREQTIVWDGRDDRGRAVPRGVYYLVLESESSRASGRVIRMR